MSLKNNGDEEPPGFQVKLIEAIQLVFPYLFAVLFQDDYRTIALRLNSRQAEARPDLGAWSSPRARQSLDQALPADES
jgi:hypothetical protein